MKHNFFSIFALITIFTTYLTAQDSEKKFSGSLIFGKGQSLSGNIIPTSPSSTSWSVNGSAPVASGISADNSLVNMIGAEFRFFTSPTFALKLSGSGIFRDTPMQENMPGVINGNNSAAWIPNYDATISNNSMDANISVGGEYHFKSESKISPFLGLSVPVCYSRYSQYDPTVTIDAYGNALIADVGMRHVEALGFGGQLVIGADYYLTDGLFIALEIKPVSYLYAYNIKYPAPGLETRSADTHTFGFFTQPVFKLGIRF